MSQPLIFKGLYLVYVEDLYIFHAEGFYVFHAPDVVGRDWALTGVYCPWVVTHFGPLGFEIRVVPISHTGSHGLSVFGWLVW